jgi:diguanylate cyclase (GGDEF)-like protein/PAS domain S-box-containing protein
MTMVGGIGGWLRRRGTTAPDAPASGRWEGPDLFRILVEHTTDVLWLLDGAYAARFVSASVTPVLGWAEADLIGKTPRDLVHPEDMPKIAEAMRRAMGGEAGPRDLTCRVRRTDGAFVWVECRTRGIRDPESGDALEGVVIAMRDISERIRFEEELALQAMTDGLTGLANRRAFDKALSAGWREALETGGEISLVLADIDCFKAFNDTFGHQAGDDCLRVVGQTLKATLSEAPGALAARYGGEELAIVLPMTPLEAAVRIAETARAAVEAQAIPHGRNEAGLQAVTMSFGVASALARDGGTVSTAESLLLAVDGALYKAKSEGRNRVATSIVMAQNAHPGSGPDSTG